MRGTRFVLMVAIGWNCGTAIGDVTIRGRVADATGKPIPKALVFWLRPAPINSFPESIDGQADDQGVFELRLTGPESPATAKREAMLIYAEGYGLGSKTVGDFATATTDQEPLVIRLPEQSSMAFRVVDPEGHPLAGELVEPVTYGMRLPLSFVQALARATNHAGIAEFPALASGKLSTIRVVSQVYGTQQLDRRFGDVPLDNTIQLRAPARVEVRFVKPDGVSMRKCKMLAFTTGSEPAPGPIPGSLRSPLQGAFSEFFDDNGGFDIPAIAHGTLRFQLSGCANDEPVMPHWPESTALKAGAVERFTVPFEKTVTIHGRVLDRMTEKPCPFAEIYVYTRYAGCALRTYADENGLYRCNVLRGPAGVQATLRDPESRRPLASSSLVERVIGPEGLEFPDLLVANGPSLEAVLRQ